MATPIFPPPSQVFIGSGTDWPEASDYVNQMVSYLNANGKCCPSTIPCKISFMYFGMLVDSPEELNNSERWHNDIEAIYRSLYPLV